MSKFLLNVLSQESIVEDVAHAIHDEKIKPFSKFFSHFCQIHDLSDDSISSYNSDIIAVLEDVFSNILLEDPSDEREYSRRKQEQQRYILSMLPMLKLALTRSEQASQSSDTSPKVAAQYQSEALLPPPTGEISSPVEITAADTCPPPPKQPDRASNSEKLNHCSPTETTIKPGVVKSTLVDTEKPVAINSAAAVNDKTCPIASVSNNTKTPPTSTGRRSTPKPISNTPFTFKAQSSPLTAPIKSTEKRSLVPTPIVSTASSSTAKQITSQTKRTPTSTTRNSITSPVVIISPCLSITTKNTVTSPKTPNNLNSARSPSSVVSPNANSSSPTAVSSTSQQRAFRKLSNGSNSSNNSLTNNNGNAKKLSPAMEQVKRQQAAKEYYNRLSRSAC